MSVYVLYHGVFGGANKQLLGVYKTVEGAKARAALVVAEEEAIGMGNYSYGPGLTFTDSSGCDMLYRGMRENNYSLWVEPVVLGD